MSLDDNTPELSDDMPSPDGAAWAEFDKISVSPYFASHQKSLSLLKYLLTEELNGRGNQIKAYSIALDVFGRRADFNAATDSTVRNETKQLRLLLNAYYTANPDASLRIEIPVGSYRPRLITPSQEVEVEDQPIATPDAAANTSKQTMRWVWLALILGLIIAAVTIYFLIHNKRSPSRLQSMACSSELPTVSIQNQGSTTQSRTDLALSASVERALSQFAGLRVVPAEAANIVCPTATPHFIVKLTRIGEEAESISAQLTQNGLRIAEQTFKSTASDRQSENDSFIAGQIADWLAGTDARIGVAALAAPWPTAESRKRYDCLQSTIRIANQRDRRIEAINHVTDCTNQVAFKEKSASADLHGAIARVKLYQLVGLLPRGERTPEQLREETLETYARSGELNIRGPELFKTQAAGCLYMGHQELEPVLDAYLAQQQITNFDFRMRCRNIMEKGYLNLDLNAGAQIAAATMQTMIFGENDAAMRQISRAKFLSADERQKPSLTELIERYENNQHDELKQQWNQSRPADPGYFDVLIYMASAHRSGDVRMTAETADVLRGIAGAGCFKHAADVADPLFINPTYAEVFNDALEYAQPFDFIGESQPFVSDIRYEAGNHLIVHQRHGLIQRCHMVGLFKPLFCPGSELAILHLHRCSHKYHVIIRGNFE